MDKKIIEDKQYHKTDFRIEVLERADYEYCSFSNCNFSNVDLSHLSFIECSFDGCNLSNVKLSKTAFRDVKFTNCKLLGLHFEDCSDFLFSVRFEKCSISFSSFYKMKLKKTVFKNCTLQELDFADADLSNAIFDRCDLARTLFINTDLSKADFTSSFNYTIDPETNNLKGAKFSKDGLSGLLNKYDIVIE